MIDLAAGVPVSTAHVLLVEDDDVIRLCVTAWLVSLGWQVTAVPTAEAAVECASRQVFPLAVVDIMLAGNADGVWVSSQLRQVSPSTQVIFATGVDDLPGSATMRPNVSGYLVKPYSRRDLQRAIERVCASTPAGPAGPAMWPARALPLIAEGRQALAARVQEALRRAPATDEALVTLMLPDEDAATLGKMRRHVREVAARVKLDPVLTTEVERAVCFSGLGRAVFPAAEVVPELSPEVVAALTDRDAVRETKRVLDMLGMPTAGELLVRASLPSPGAGGTRAPLDLAAEVLRGVLVWRDAVTASQRHGYAPPKAAADAMMHVLDEHAALDPAVVEAIGSSYFRRTGPNA